MTKPQNAQTDFWSTFRPNSWRGVLAIASLVLFLVTPTLAYFVSSVFLILLPLAWIMSIVAHFRGTGLDRSARLVRTGHALAFNGVVLIASLFIVGFLSDFVFQTHGEATPAVAAGFSTVHVLFGTGLVLSEVRKD